MYGLLLENFSEYIKSVYGEDKWEEIRRKALVEQPSFSVHQVYSESLIPRLAKTAMEVSAAKILTARERFLFSLLDVEYQFLIFFLEAVLFFILSSVKCYSVDHFLSLFAHEIFNT